MQARLDITPPTPREEFSLPQSEADEQYTQDDFVRTMRASASKYRRYADELRALLRTLTPFSGASEAVAVAVGEMTRVANRCHWYAARPDAENPGLMHARSAEDYLRAILATASASSMKAISVHAPAMADAKAFISRLDGAR